MPQQIEPVLHAPRILSKSADRGPRPLQPAGLARGPLHVPILERQIGARAEATLILLQDRLRQGDAVVLLEVGEAQLHRQAPSLQGLTQLRVVALELGIDALQGKDPLGRKDPAEGIHGGRFLVGRRHRPLAAFVADVVHAVPECLHRVLELEQVAADEHLTVLTALSSGTQPLLNGDRADRAEERADERRQDCGHHITAARLARSLPV
jgi:hypothetical protein